jgi:hypothetical protein
MSLGAQLFSSQAMHVLSGPGDRHYIHPGREYRWSDPGNVWRGSGAVAFWRGHPAPRSRREQSVPKAHEALVGAKSAHFGAPERLSAFARLSPCVVNLSSHGEEMRDNSSPSLPGKLPRGRFSCYLTWHSAGKHLPAVNKMIRGEV